MSHSVVIPPVGESISSGTLSTWHVENGQSVEVGQNLFSLETDKITTEVEAEVAGVIELLAEEGQEVEIGAEVAQIAEANSEQLATQAASEQGQQEGQQRQQQEPQEQQAHSDEQVEEQGEQAGSAAEDQKPAPEANSQEETQLGQREKSGQSPASTAIEVPAVGESITTGTLSQWFVEDGQEVLAGASLFALETDKITQEVEAPVSGVLTQGVPAGSEVEVGQQVGEILATGTPSAVDEEISEPEDAAPTPEPQSDKEPSEPSENQSAPAHIRQSLSESAKLLSEQKRQQAAGRTANAKEGSAAKAPSAPPQTKPQAPAEQGARESRQKMTQLRRKIATHLVNAQQTAAILTTFNEVDMSAVMGLRKELQEGFVARHGLKLGFMSFFVKAVVAALQEVPAVNARIEGTDIVQQHYYDIGVAVGTPKGLVVPVLRDCEQKSFAQIEQDIARYALAAKEGKLGLEDLKGGVFTVSNGGVYGSLLSTPILNPPQSGILGMHTIQQRPVAVDGKVEIRPMMYLALSYDHRLVDGKEAVSFLLRIKECIEQPTRLMLQA